jgi:hypothetical protein
MIEYYHNRLAIVGVVLKMELNIFFLTHSVKLLVEDFIYLKNGYFINYLRLSAIILELL